MKKRDKRQEEGGSAWLNATCEILKGGVLAGIVTIVSLLVCAILVSMGVLPVSAMEGAVLAVCVLGTLIGGVYAVGRSGGRSLLAGLGVGAVLFLLLLVPFGIEGPTGNRSWISFPFLPFNIQPAELCKIPFIIILAKTMQTNQRKLSAPRSILQLGFQVAFIVLLILVLSKDAGVALVYVFIFLVMAFVGGVKLRWFLAGFAAATVLRGVDYIQVPTTLLAQVDSSVGGKVAIDLNAGKNLAGAFWQPKLVLMDPATLDTLDDKTFSDGMAEVIKYGCIANKGLFNFLLSHPSRGGVMERIEYVLTTCCDLKREVVEADEHDTGRRMLLNFGHTLGHAYERAGHYETWTHGQAVSAGMVAAAKLGIRMGLTPQRGVVEFLTQLLEAFDLPTAIGCSPEDYAAAIGLDKKGSGGDISLIVLDTLGAAHAHKMGKDELLREIAAL